MSYPGLELKEETINGFKVKFLIPSDYTKDPREERSQLAFYSDRTMMMDESSLIYFSQEEPRSFFTIVSCNIEDDPYRYSDYMKGGEIYLDSIMSVAQLSSDKGWTYRMPLLQKRRDKYGHPITTIQYITRYMESDTIWGIPIINEGGIEKDSVEAIVDFITIIGTDIIECYYYSLDSYENFSYERFLKIINSITVSK
ncbi:MAG: hypothetical protein J6T88_00130 [Bacteroidales bacterium]|nr:hypothetical protein [Bacteroidales bacterium]